MRELAADPIRLPGDAITQPLAVALQIMDQMASGKLPIARFGFVGHDAPFNTRASSVSRPAMLKRYSRMNDLSLGQGKAMPYDSDFRAKKSIIAFSVNWRNATGRIAKRTTFVDGPSHTSKGQFWELA